MIDITGLNKADVLAALYNASRPQGMGFLQAEPMTREQATALLEADDIFRLPLEQVMNEVTELSTFDNGALRLGLADVVDYLIPAIDKAVKP